MPVILAKQPAKPATLATLYEVAPNLSEPDALQVLLLVNLSAEQVSQRLRRHDVNGRLRSPIRKVKHAYQNRI